MEASTAVQLQDLRCRRCQRLLCRHSGQAVIEMKCVRCKELVCYRPPP